VPKCVNFEVFDLNLANYYHGHCCQWITNELFCERLQKRLKGLWWNKGVLVKSEKYCKILELWMLLIEHENCRLQNKSFQQMQPIIYLYCICYFSPYMFQALTRPSSGVSWAACFMLPFGSCSAVVCLCVRGRTDRQQHCMNQMVA
jgi:hypothetical protein